MNKRSRWLLHPAVLYLILLILVIIISWIGSIIEIKHSVGNGDLSIRSVLGISGVRWAVRAASDCLKNAPVGNAVMLFMTIGLAKSCGLFNAVRHFKSLSPKEQTSLYAGFAALVICLVVVVLGLFVGSNLLLSVTGKLSGSPLYDGCVFLLLMAVSIPSLVYGLLSDTIRSLKDCMNAFAFMAVPMSHFIITMLIASQLIQTLEYTNLYQFVGLNLQSLKYFAFIIYWIPLPVILLLYGSPAKNISNQKP